MLLRPLPVADSHRLFFVTTTFVDTTTRRTPTTTSTTPPFSAIGHCRGIRRIDGRRDDGAAVGEITAGEPEPLYRQYVSGNVFGSFGLQPALGRLIGPGDDVQPGGHPVAVLSHDFWTRRFGGDPGVVGRTLRLGSQPYEIIGVAPRGFTGTEPGRLTDVFIPR